MWGFQNRVCLSIRLSICPYPEKRNHHSFVNISPTLVIDTSMERSSRVLRHGNPKIWFFFFQKSSKFEFWLLTKSWNHLSFVNISPTLVIDTSMEWSSRVLYTMETQKCENFSKSSKLTKLNSFRTPSFRMPRKKKRPGFVNISPTWVIDMSTERSSRVLQHGNQKIWFFFFKKVWNWIRLVFWLVLKSWNHSSRTYRSTLGMHRRPFEGRHLV